MAPLLVLIFCIANVLAPHPPSQTVKEHNIQWYKLIMDELTPRGKEIQEKLTASLSEHLENEFRKVPPGGRETIHFQLDGKKYVFDIDKEFKGTYPWKDGFLHLRFVPNDRWFPLFRNVR